MTGSPYQAGVTVDGEDLEDIAMRLEDIALRLREPGREAPVNIYGVGFELFVTRRSAPSEAQL